ncbi:hypothetical protein EDM53_02425 [Rickettsiales endosymbiont of Peranema trichophorum]|nr:DUF5394 family protein [Rickettsiales endosymbiont of Peranema trichophorum]RZI47304.1 hypothetical protein EDM53_02425 [Rickettsiales endosymbiont of Peranema trichophorum]
MTKEVKLDQKLRAIRDLKPKTLLKLLEVVYDFKGMFDEHGQVNSAKLEANKELLVAILEYLIVHAHSLKVDAGLIIFLENVLGIGKIKKDAQKEQEEQEQEEKELSNEEKERRYRILVYQIYKIMNPRRLAGETKLDNFIHNVQARGIKEAMKYEGMEYAKNIKQSDVNAMESNRGTFLARLKSDGLKPKGGTLLR